MRNQRFTLIELLTVIGIILVLASMILGVTSLVTGTSREAKTKARLEALMTALQEHYQDRGYYPRIQNPATTNYSDTEWVPFSLSLSDFRSSQTGRPYMEDYEGGAYMDAWRHPFEYTTSATVALGTSATGSDTGFWLRSGGAEATNTNDDICSWKQR